MTGRWLIRGRGFCSMPATYGGPVRRRRRHRRTDTSTADFRNPLDATVFHHSGGTSADIFVVPNAPARDMRRCAKTGTKDETKSVRSKACPTHGRQMPLNGTMPAREILTQWTTAMIDCRLLDRLSLVVA